ncbi:hypothetical protein IGI04_011188 [Brassica rapa subsp. trilocularis]|uniref:HSF-type DNA-binding domain-containing protein n=1 Tax=Brassica rapa subsp. trilocularis TaxID=1813537 RepID=A0ABQ7N2C4_BRACM|nr:hypothetical protein IGI04_011188 [Brassica rapa subsp. trilocularis]
MGFRKLVPDRWEFSNDCFRRGEKILLRDIQRRKISLPAAAPVLAHVVSPSNSGEEQVISSNSSPAGTGGGGGSVGVALQRTTSCTTAPELMEENERLRKENVQLSQELTKLKGLYSNIYKLMSNFTSGGADCVKPLDLMPERQEMSEEAIETGAGLKLLTPRLFGVSIGVKRARRDQELGAAAAEEDDNQEEEEQGSDDKSEPMEENNSVDHNGPWLELGKLVWLHLMEEARTGALRIWRRARLIEDLGIAK